MTYDLGLEILTCLSTVPKTHLEVADELGITRAQVRRGITELRDGGIMISFNTLKQTVWLDPSRAVELQALASRYYDLAYGVEVAA